MAAKIVRWVPAFVLAMALPQVTQATNSNEAVAKQIQTATAHAGMALGADDLKMAHAHLQHAINCLAGPSGEGYDAKAANPCQGMGQGAIADARGDAAREAQLQMAVDLARHGVRATTLDAAHEDAQKVMSSLQAK